MKNELIAGTIGTFVSSVGTATQTNEVLKTISLVVTIIGAILTYIIMPSIMWYKSAKKDGKITKDEIKDGVNTIVGGVDKVKDTIKRDKEE